MSQTPPHRKISFANPKTTVKKKKKKAISNRRKKKKEERISNLILVYMSSETRKALKI